MYRIVLAHITYLLRCFSVKDKCSYGYKISQAAIKMPFSTLLGRSIDLITNEN